MQLSLVQLLCNYPLYNYCATIPLETICINKLIVTLKNQLIVLLLQMSLI
jgi:hypothetical protein